VNALEQVLALLVFPGLLFCVFLGFFLEWVDRKIYARLQNRMGPPWFQPMADFMKLLSKEDMVAATSNAKMTEAMGVLAVASATAAVLYLPVGGKSAVLPFAGDLVVVMFFLTLPTVAFFLAGWYSASPFGIIGAVRTASQFLAYEIPLTMAIAAPAILAGTWSVSGIVEYSQENPWYVPVMVLGLLTSLIALQGKLERVPFDAPEAETEVVAGTLTEFSGRRLAMFRLATDIELVAGAILISDLFLGGAAGPFPVGLLVMLLKASAIVFVLSCVRAVTARLRIGQVVSFCWQVLVPVSALQIGIVFALRGVGRA
jgi:NADH-quinone oxidoreductase subunit H